MSTTTDTDTDGWGVDHAWIDTTEQRHDVPTATIDAIHDLLGAPAHAGRSLRVVRPGAEVALGTRCAVHLEDGQDAGEHDVLPPDLPIGIHELHPVDGGDATWCLVGPGRCHLPEDLRTWGVTMQVPTTRSRGSWGIGDLADVRTLAEWVASRGGGAVGLSPLHAVAPVPPIPRSPYSPSSRRWHSPLLLRVDEIPRFSGSTPSNLRGKGGVRAALSPSGSGGIVDRDAVWARQRAALEEIWAARTAEEERELTRFRREHGVALEGWARFCALSDRHGPGWSAWPAELRHPDSPAVTRAAGADADRVAFHAWLQLLLERQLRAANVDGIRLVQDLAVGADPDGADAWLHQDLLALGASIGAPPDDFAPDGQVWGLPPWVPWRLRDAGYRPLAELFRAAMAEEGGVRIDHVMGLSRLFWVLEGADPCDGAYVRFPGRELLEVLALESARARAIVVGEDLGTVEREYRDQLRTTRVLSTRLIWFEDEPPEAYPAESLAMVTTHDLPTTVGAWTGADGEELADLGRPSPPDAEAELQARLHRLVGLGPDAPVDDVLVRVHRRLGRARSMLALATLEDLTAVAHRPNVPGTTTERTNWSTALPVLLDDLPSEPLASRIVTALADGRGPTAPG